MWEAGMERLSLWTEQMEGQNSHSLGEGTLVCREVWLGHRFNVRCPIDVQVEESNRQLERRGAQG